jgi:hypothetical protein
MKSPVAPALLFFCLCSLLPLSDAQTKPNKNQPLPYRDTDGYQVLSSIINARTEKLKSGFVSVFHQTVSEKDSREVRVQCSSSFSREFESALKDFDKKARTRFLLQREFSIRKQYRFVETMVGVNDSTKSLPGIYSFSAVGFDDNKTRAIVLVPYLVRPGGSIVLGGDTIFYVLRRTESGWQQAADIQTCGRIY